MKLLANPIFLRAGFVLFFSGFAFVLGLLMVRKLRKAIAEEAEISSEPTPSLETLPVHLYNTVIQQLKQQKHELQVQSQAELNRARTSETVSQAVLSNLPCGVLIFGANGLVKTSNPAAKEILGFASTTGMGIEDIFRGAEVRAGEACLNEAPSQEAACEDCDESAGDDTFDASVCEAFDGPSRLADEVEIVLRHEGARRQTAVDYETPAGERRFLIVTISPVPTGDGGLLGVACLINDLSELEHIRRQQELRGEISAEMALQLRSSLATISGYAQQLAGSRDPELARQIASDIANEAAQLDRSIGGFLVGKSGTTAGAASAG